MIDDYPMVEITPLTAERLIKLVDYVYSQAKIEPPGVSRCRDEMLLNDCAALALRLRANYSHSTGRDYVIS